MTKITSKPPAVVVRSLAGKLREDCGRAIIKIRTEATMHDTDIVMSGGHGQWSIDTVANNVPATRICMSHRRFQSMRNYFARSP